MRPPVVLRVVPNARHTYAYHPSTDVRAPSLRDARHAGFRMTHDEMVRDFLALFLLLFVS